MSDDTLNINMAGLDKLIKAFDKTPHALVGVIGEKNSRDELQGNAQIGLDHEFGTEKLAKRSFLREPLKEFLCIYLDEAGAFDEEVIKSMIAQGNMDWWMEKIGVVAETVVADAFDSGGFGKWKESDMSKKDNHQTMIETQQLRNAIGSRLEKGISND